MTLGELDGRVKDVLSQFAQLANWEACYKKLIDMGKKLPPLDESLRSEEYKVKGCQSQVWLVPQWQDGKIVFSADSDAAIVKGIVALLLKVYNDATPEEIMATKPTFVDDLGLKQHLSMNRTNGLASLLKQIFFYALAFQAKHRGEE